MIENVNAQQTGESAANYFGDGYHCAEAVVAACLEAAGENAANSIAHATAFGGGVGKTFTEICGAISGSLIVIGHIHGRRAQHESWDFPADLGAAIHAAFLSKHGNCNCGILRERFGDEMQMLECRKLVRQTTVDLIRLLQGISLSVANTCEERLKNTDPAVSIES